jgi:argininosuccinate synthase
MAGAASLEIIDGRKRYYESCIRYLVYGNVLKNGTYPLSVSAERVVQAILLAETAKKKNILNVAHGSTGAGNDQVRFDMLLEILIPEVNIITPIRDLKLSREAEIEYLKKEGIRMDFTKAAYSVNKGIWGTSVGGKETLTSDLTLPEEAWPTSVTKHHQEKITLGFDRGELKTVNGQTFEHTVDAIESIRTLAAPFGIGRDIHVGDTIIGIKGRVGFEAAAPLLIIKAHHALEKHILSKWQLYWKDQLALWYGNWLHEGQYFEPAMRDIEQMFESSQRHVTGEVFVMLEPYRFSITGIRSENDLMQSQKGVYGEMNSGWSGEDVKGFTKIFGNQIKTWMHLHSQKAEHYEQV